MNILQLLRPAPFVQQIEDEEAVGNAYRYWRRRIFSGIYIGYVFFLFSRKSMTFAIPVMMQQLGMTKSSVGILSSIFAITYGASKFLSGMIADRSNPRYFMSIGLICTGIATFFFSLSSSMILFALLCSVNAFFQGWGWPPCARQLTHWFSQKERGTWWGFWNTSTSLGIATIGLFSAHLADYFGWRIAVSVPSLICILGGFLIMSLLRDTPQSLGLPSIEVFNQEESATGARKEKELSVKEILVQHVLVNRYLWILGTAYFFIYMIRAAITEWGLIYLIETKGYSVSIASICIVSVEIGGFFGSIAAGWASDYYFKGKRGPVTALFSLAILLPLSYFWLGATTHYFIEIAQFCLAGFLIYGPQMVIGMYAAELAHKKAAATASGFTGTFAYAGAAVAGYPLSLVIQQYGWQEFFAALICASIAASLLLLPLWSVKKRTEPVTAI